MARAPSRSIAHPPRSAHHGLNRRLRRWLAAELRQLRPTIRASAARCHAERYRKHFDSFAHAWLLRFHGLAGMPNLRRSYHAFAVGRGLAQLSGLASTPAADDDTLGISFSQFADSNTTRPAAFLAGIVPGLLARVRQCGRLPTHTLPDDLQVFDSTCLRLSLKLAAWLPSSGPSDVPCVRVHDAPAWDLPEHLLVTDTRTNDVGGLDHLLLDDPTHLASVHNQTLVFDLGYSSHTRFVRLRAAQVHFVTRRHPQATLVVHAEVPIQGQLAGLATEQRITVWSDQRVTVGSVQNRAGAVLSGLRLVTARVEPLPAAARPGAQPVVYQVLTDRWDLDAIEVVQVYRWRWTIEIVCSQVTKTGVSAGVGCWDDVPNLHRAVRHDHTVNQQFDQLSTLLECCVLQAGPQARTDVADRLRQHLDLDQTLALGGEFSFLRGRILLSLAEFRVFALERCQINRPGQVRVQQPLVLPREAIVHAAEGRLSAA